MSKLLPIEKGKDNQILRQKSRELTPEELKSEEVQGLISDMFTTMKEQNGIGLAAPQVGKNFRIFTIAFKDNPLACINPKISKKSFAKEIDDEGCLSLPGRWGSVKRSKKVTLKFLDATGEESSLTAEGLLARAIQHENDHLDGVLFIDKLEK